MVKFISVCLSLLIGLQPIVHACENIEPIDPESLEYDPQAFIKKTIRTEGTLGDRAEEVGKALVRGLEYASDFFVVGGEIANGFFLAQSIHDLEDAIEADDAQGAILATVNTIAAIGLPILSEINPVAGIIMGLTLFEAQAIVSIVEQSHAYHTIVNQLHAYESALEDKIRQIESRFVSDIQYIALPQDQLHLTMAANTNFLYRLVALNASKRDVVSRLQNTVDSFCEGVIEYEMQQAFDRGNIVDLPLLNSNQLFSSVVEMEHLLSEHINELREQIKDADFLASNGFLHSVNTQVIDRLSTNLYEVLPPIVDDMKVAIHSKSNFIEELTYENSRHGRLSYLSTHLDWLEEYTWLLFNHHFAQHPHLLGDGFIDPAVSTSVLAASAFIPVAGLVLLAVASPAIGGKVLANDYALLQQIIGLQNMRAYVDAQGAGILHDSDSLNAAITHFVHHSHAHPFIKGDALVNVLHEGVQAAREEALRFLPHALDADIHQEDIGDVYAAALQHIEELEKTEEGSIRFALDPEVHLMLPVLDQMEPMITLNKADHMNIYFSSGTLEKSEDLGSKTQWELVASNSPYRVSNQVQDTAFFRVKSEQETSINENEIGMKMKEQGATLSNLDDQASSMPGGITMKHGKIVVEAFVEPDNAFATNVVYAHLDQIEDTLQEDLHRFIDLVANPQQSTHALTWLEEAKDEAIMEIAIQEGFRATCGIILRQLINFLSDSDRSADAFETLKTAIELDWSLYKNEVIAHVANEPVDYYQLDRIPGTQWVIDQYTGWAAAMQENVASNGWQATDRYPSELVDFIHENNIESERVGKIVAGYGMRMKKNSEWSRSAQSKMVMGAFPREILKHYAQRQGMDADNLTFSYTFDYGFHASVDGDGQLTWKDSDTVGTANIIENNQFGEDDNLAMWPMVYWSEKSSSTFSVFYNLFTLLKARVASGGSGYVVLSDGDTSETVPFSVSNFCEDNSSSDGYTEVSAMVWNNPYTCRMPVSLALVRLQDDTRFRGCVVEADLNLAEFIWMTRRREYDHTQLSEVKMKAYVLNHQRYDHTLPHEGEDAKKTVDRDLTLVSEQVILDEADLAMYRSGVLPPALTTPIVFNFNTTDAVPVHTEFEISNMSTYCELICVEIIFNGVTEYVFYPKQGNNLLADGSSSDGAKTADYHMYYYDYAPLQGGHVEYFNQYNRAELEELEYSVIAEEFQ